MSKELKSTLKSRLPFYFKMMESGFIIIFIGALFMSCFTFCKNSRNIDLYGEHIDTLKVVTLYGPTSYFNYREEIMGVDYENVRRFAEEEGMVTEFKILSNIQDLIMSLKKGEAHLAAYPVPMIAEYISEVEHCGNKEISHQVLVQRRGNDMITDVTELIGKDVYVEKDSKFQYRLENLNEETGGGINIKKLENDTIVNEDFLEIVDKGKIDYAVIDSNIASLYQSAYPSLDFSMAISSDQASSWVVAKGLDSLASKINRWEINTHTPDIIREIYKRYYDSTLAEDFDSNLTYFKKLKRKREGSVSDYDEIFKKYSAISKYDWRLLAAIAYCESRFNPTVESRFGAYGLMQVMPATSKAVGVDPAALGNPDNNILAAARILAKLDAALIDKVEDPSERMKFVVAAYNSGLGHIYDAMSLAEKTGLDPQRWLGNVSVATLMKSRPEYYNDPVVKHGYFRGRETVDFVEHVTSIYNYLTQKE